MPRSKKKEIALKLVHELRLSLEKTEMRWEPSFRNSIAECSISNEDIQITPLVGSMTRNKQPALRVEQNEANFIDSSLEIEQTVTLKQLVATKMPRKHQRI